MNSVKFDKYYPKNKQVNLEARKADENGHIFNYQGIPKSSVKYFTDALFGIMPECKEIVETLHLLNFLLFDGQANEGLYMFIEVKSMLVTDEGDSFCCRQV